MGGPRATVRITAGAEADLHAIWRRRLAQRGAGGPDGAEALLDDLDAVGLHVILDPMHLKGAGERDGNWHEVPAWAWAIAPAVPNYAAAMDHMLARLDAHAGGYLTEMTRRVADRSAVIAIDLVNEP